MTTVNPVAAFAVVATVLFMLALVPFFVHPQFRRTPNRATGYLVVMATAAGGITMLGMSQIKGWAAPVLLLYAALIVIWTVAAAKTRHRSRQSRRKAKAHAERIAYFNREAGQGK